MTDAIANRGPDAHGAWCDTASGTALGHRRLSILDLSELGAQPMHSVSGRYTIVYNGEVYNFAALRVIEESHGTIFRGHSDTEVMLAAIERVGLEAAVRTFEGMFAFALWDRELQALHLVRDRFGEKPLYYAVGPHGATFGSELKALKAHPDWSFTVDREALALYLRHNCVPAPYTIFAGVRKVPPGSIVTVTKDFAVEIREYWSIEQVALAGTRNPFTAPLPELVEQLDLLLRRVVKDEMVSDVPLGAFLSGGLDSSLVVALMQAQSGTAVQSFTIGFTEQQYDEAGYAAKVAEHLGTSHTTLYVSPADALAVVPRLPTIYDEPFADSSQIPTCLVAALARRSVTVALSGDGADELFGGYGRYFMSERWWQRLRRVPLPLRQLAGRGIRSVKPSTWDRVVSLTGVAQRAERPTGDRIHKAAALLDVRDTAELYRRLVSHWENPGALLRGVQEPTSRLDGAAHDALDPVSSMMLMDSQTYLPDDILVKVDRAGMAVSLEGRAPYLHPAVAEFAWRLPLEHRVHRGQGKLILRALLDRYVPRPLLDRPKMGFGVPLDSWLRGPLRDWAEALLSEERLTREGFFDPAPIRERWTEHLNGRQNWQYPLWTVLMFQSWLEAQST